jgi:hypothetical protein
MFKKILALVVLASVSTVAFAQGTVNFATAALGTTAQVFAPGGGLATGSAYMAQLFAAPGTVTDASQLVAVGVPVGFRSGVNAGYVQQSGNNLFGGSTVDPVVIITAAAAGGPVTVQLRAWDATSSTYAAALTKGASALLTLASTGNPNGSPPGTPADLTGLTGFTMTTVSVPEPTTLALVLLGGAALLIRRRK